MSYNNDTKQPKFGIEIGEYKASPLNKEKSFIVRLMEVVSTRILGILEVGEEMYVSGCDIIDIKLKYLEKMKV